MGTNDINRSIADDPKFRELLANYRNARDPHAKMVRETLQDYIDSLIVPPKPAGIDCAALFERAALAAESEKVDSAATQSPEDIAYNIAIDHAAEAVRALKDRSAAPPAAPVRLTEWISVADRLPETDADDMAYVWAVDEGAGRFPRKPTAGNARFHKSLGWQVEGSTNWDWDIKYWMHKPALPEAPVQAAGTVKGGE